MTRYKILDDLLLKLYHNYFLDYKIIKVNNRLKDMGSELITQYSIKGIYYFECDDFILDNHNNIYVYSLDRVFFILYKSMNNYRRNIILQKQTIQDNTYSSKMFFSLCE